MTTELAAFTCPSCGHTPQLSTINLLTGNRGLPMPGDLVVCGACGELLYTLADTTPAFRVATHEEILNIPYEQRLALLNLLRSGRE